MLFTIYICYLSPYVYHLSIIYIYYIFMYYLKGTSHMAKTVGITRYLYFLCVVQSDVRRSQFCEIQKSHSVIICS